MGKSIADVDPLTGMLTPESIEKELKRTKKSIKIITVVHLGGRLCDLENISKFAKKYGCYLVEDMSHEVFLIKIAEKSHKVGACKYSIASSLVFML